RPPGFGSASQFSVGRAPACATESPKFRLLGAAPRRPANNHRGRGRQAMHLPCKQADAGASPADSTNLRSVELRLGRPFHRGENEIQASLISSASVGATPTPATNALFDVVGNEWEPELLEALKAD